MPRVAKVKEKIVDNPFAWIALVISVIILSVLAVIVTFQDSLFDGKVLAVVGDKKIYENDLNESIYGLGFLGSLSEPQETSTEVKKQLLDDLIEYEILEKKAEELGITVADEKIESYAKETVVNYENLISSQKEIVKKNAKLALLRNLVKDKILTWSEGKLLICSFYLHYYGPPSDKTEAEREALIPKDKEYAKNKAQELYDAVSSGKMTFDQAMNVIKNDSVVGNVAWKPYTMTFTSEFTKEDSIEQAFPNNAPEFWKQVAEAEEGTLSEPILVKIKLNEDTSVGKDGELVDGAYLLVDKKDGNRGEAYSYDEWLKAQKDKYKVKTYL